MGFAFAGLVSFFTILTSAVFWIAFLPAIVVYGIGILFKNRGVLILAGIGGVIIGIFTGNPVYMLLDLAAVAVAVVMAWRELSPTAAETAAKRAKLASSRLEAEREDFRRAREQEAARQVYLASDEYKWKVAQEKLARDRAQEQKKNLLRLFAFMCIAILVLISFLPKNDPSPPAMAVTSENVKKQAALPISSIASTEISNTKRTEARPNVLKTERKRKASEHVSLESDSRTPQLSELERCLRIVDEAAMIRCVEKAK